MSLPRFATRRVIPFALAISLGLSACNRTDGPAETAEDDSDIPAVEVPELDAALTERLIRELASDEFLGRMPGTEGETKTVELLIREFEAAGLEPGNNGSWTQDVPLVAITAQDVAPLTFTGPDTNMSLNYGPDFVGSTYRMVDDIAIEDSELVFVGYGIDAPEKDWNDYEGIDVRGKTVVILVNDPDWETLGNKGDFNGRAMTYYGRWTYKYEEAARKGAAAALIVHDTEPAAYGWNVVESSWSGPQNLAANENRGMDQTMMNGWITLDKARELFRSVGEDFDTLRDKAKSRGFEAMPLTGVTASTSFSNQIETTTSKNVIGILEGAKRPEEYVLYTAHWDHLGECGAAEESADTSTAATPAESGDEAPADSAATTPGAGRSNRAANAPDTICNGAVDNATGTAALVTLAKAHAGQGAADRSLVFLALTAEESGLLGSKYYAENPVFPLAKTVGGVNMDALSVAGPTRDLMVIGKGKSELDRYLEKAADNQERVLVAEPTPEKGYYYRSDHFSFAKLGVPMLYFESGEDMVEGGTAAGKAAAEEYTANRYHAAGDEVTEDWSWDGIMQNLRMYYEVGRMLAMTDAWPNWVEGDEFRQTRDQSRAALRRSEAGQDDEQPPAEAERDTAI